MAELYNRDIYDITHWLDDVKAEMIASQSSRLHRGFIPGEKRRYEELLTALVERIKGMEPADFPEVHPTLVVPENPV